MPIDLIFIIGEVAKKISQDRKEASMYHDDSNVKMNQYTNDTRLKIVKEVAQVAIPLVGAGAAYIRSRCLSSREKEIVTVATDTTNRIENNEMKYNS